MGFCGWCSIESKPFGPAVEGNSFGVWILLFSWVKLIVGGC
jgi:hypothetical protein